MPDLIGVRQELLERADYDEDYALWLQRLADACDRFINTDLSSIIDCVANEVTPWEMYTSGQTPEVYFKNTVMSVLEVDFGVDYLEEIVHDNVMWGELYGA